MTQYVNLIPNSEFTGFVPGVSVRGIHPYSGGTTAYVGGYPVEFTATGANAGARGTGFATAGLVRFSATLNTWSTTSATRGIGFATRSYASNFNSSSLCVGIAGNGTVVYNSTVLLTLKGSNLAAGDVLDQVLDITNGLYWGRIGGGNWNNDATAVPGVSGGLSCPGLVGAGPIVAFMRMVSIGEKVTFCFGDVAYTYTTGWGTAVDFPLSVTPGWSWALDACAVGTVESVSTVNNRQQLSIGIQTFYANPSGSTITLGLVSTPQACGTSTYGFQAGAASNLSGSSGRRMAVMVYDASMVSLTSGTAAVGGSSVIAGTNATISHASAAFVQARLETTLASAAALSAMMTMYLQQPQIILSNTSIPYCPTTGSVTAWEWNQYTATSSLTVGTGTPASTTSVAIEVTAPGAPGGNTTAGAAGGATGCLVRANAVTVASGDVLSFTIAAKVTAADTGTTALSVLRGATEVCKADGAGAASGSTPGTGGLLANCIGDSIQIGAAGGAGATAGGGGSGPASRWGMDAVAGNAAVTTTAGAVTTARYGAIQGRPGGASGVAGSAALDPGGGAGGGGTGAGTIASGSRGEVWIGWLSVTTLSLNDTLIAVDVPTMDVGKAAADSVTMTDALGGFGYARTLTDAATMADVPPTNAASHPLADSLIMSEALAFLRTITFTDSITATDFATPALDTHQLWFQDLSDTVTITEHMLRSTMVKSLDITAVVNGMSIGPTPILTHNRPRMDYSVLPAIHDTLTITDAVSFGIDRGAALADSVAMSDSMIFFRGNMTLADSVTMTDGLTFFRNNITLADSVTMTEAMAFSGSFGVTFTDAVTISESLATARGIAQALADTATMSEALSPAQNKALADSVTMTDSLSTSSPSATYIASGTVLNSGSIPVSTSGAAIGDLIVVLNPHTSGGVPAGFTIADAYSWYIGYSAELSYKVLAATTDITFTTDNYGVVWAIYRGATTITKVASAEAASVTSLNIVMPTPAVNCVGQVLMTAEQAAQDPSAPSGFVDRVSGYPHSVFTMDSMDKLVAAGGTYTVTKPGAGATLYINGIELRS